LFHSKHSHLIINEDDLGMPENEEELEKDKVVIEG